MYYGCTCEDTTDIVYGYGGLNNDDGLDWLFDFLDLVTFNWNNNKIPHFIMPLGLNLDLVVNLLLDTYPESMNSVTHFWNADHGYESSSIVNGFATIPLGQIDINYEFECTENALIKAEKYLNFDFTPLIEWSCDDFVQTNYNYPYAIYYFITTQWNYNELVGETWNILGELVEDDAEVISEKRMGMIYENFGRASHLLADMAVPAHVHCDGHAPNDYDSYEHNFCGDGLGSNYQMYNFYYTYNKQGGLLNISSGNYVRELMTTVNQITDFFGSDDKDGE